MKKSLFGILVALGFAISIPLSNVQASFVEDVATWVQTSFFGPKIFGGWGKSKEAAVSTGKTVPAQKSVKLLKETSDHPLPQSNTMPTNTASKATYVAPIVSKSISTTSQKESVPGGCEGGVCCWDSDNGINFLSKGTTRMETITGIQLKSVSDETVGNGVLEYYCQESAQMGIAYEECGNGVGDGVCLEGETPTGTLTVEIGTMIYSDILLAGQTDVEIMKVRLRAAGGEVRVSSLQFKSLYSSDVANRVDFKLYNERGQLVQEQQMLGGGGTLEGYLAFLLTPQDEIVVPANGSTMVTIKVDVRDISPANQTGKRLGLKLTFVTADNHPEVVSNVKSEDFVIYKSEISVNHASVQPSFQDPAMALQEMYRFTVKADSKGAVQLGRLTFDVNLQGMKKSEGNLNMNDFQIRQVKSDGTVDTIANLATISSVTNASATSARVGVDFLFQNLGQEESRTYSLIIGNLANDGMMQTEDDSVAVSMVKDQDFFVSGDRNAVLGWNDIVWSDKADPSHTDLTSDWHNGYLLDIDGAAQVNNDSASTGGGTTTPKSSLSINHASTQPNFQDPSTSAQEFYRFTVKADSKGAVQLGKLTFDVNLQGMKKSSGNLGNGDFKVLQMKSDGTVDGNMQVATISSVTNVSATSARVGVDFVMQNLNAGESRTYTLLIGNLANNGFIADDDAVAVMLKNDAQAGGPDVRASIGTSYIIWSDKSSSGHSDTTSDWYNGYTLNVYGAAQVNQDSEAEEQPVSILNLTRADGLVGGQDVDPGDRDVIMLKLAMDNGDNSDVIIKEVRAFVNGDMSSSDLSTIKGALFVQGTQQGGQQPLNGSQGFVDFLDTSIVIPSGEKKDILVVVNIPETVLHGSFRVGISSIKAHDINSSGNIDTSRRAITVGLPISGDTFSIVEAPVELACAKSGEMANYTTNPLESLHCCAGLSSFDATPSTLLMGEPVLCFDPAKGKPICENSGTKSEGWYQGGHLLKYIDCDGKVVSTCIDSDMGLDYYTKGSVHLSNSRMQSRLDTCTDKFLLAEQYCLNGSMAVSNYKCENGCIDGVCLKIRKIEEIEYKLPPKEFDSI